jgi:O-antigen/teichoic acid export membrane protein
MSPKSKVKSPNKNVPNQSGEGDLTYRAGLTFMSSLLQQAAQFVVGFIVTPIVIRGLGTEIYGAWMMIKQSAGYAAQADMRPMGTLKFTLGLSQHENDVQQKRRQIGAAILIWGFTLPIILVLGGILVWAAPTFIDVADEYKIVVRVAMALVVIQIALERILTLPDNVLRGMNLHYKAMGVSAALVLLGGGFAAVAIWMEWGLPGVASAGILSSAIIGVFRFVIVKRSLPWFGVERPKRKELYSFGKLSGWLMLSGFAFILFSTSDLLLLGIVSGPAVVAIYSTTGALIRMFVGPVVKLLGSGGPGIVGLCGKKDWNRVAQIRKEMYIIGVTLITVISASIIPLNRAFLNLWIGEGFYAGHLTNLLLVMLGFTMIFIRIEGVFIDAMLMFRKKTIAMLISGLISATVGVLLSAQIGMTGMALGMMCGNIIMLTYLQNLMRNRLRYKEAEGASVVVRPLILSSLIIAAAYSITNIINPITWLSLIFCFVVFGVIALLLMWFIGLNETYKNVLILRVASQFNRDR